MPGEANDMNPVNSIELPLKVVLVVAVLVTLVPPGSATITNDNMPDSRILFEWYNEIYFYEPTGSHDKFEFGESESATDGLDFPPVDIEHAPFPPPYLAVYSIVEYTRLAKDTRFGPVYNKTWEINVQWLSSNSDPTDITISWDAAGFYGCDYTSIILSRYDPFDDEWDFAANMLSEEEYIYSPRYFHSHWLTDYFHINGTVGSTPPEIIDVSMTPSDPLDTVIGWENFTCSVIDNTGVDEVKLVLVGDTTTEYLMTKDGDDYYCNITIETADEDTYHIWANDTSDNVNTSTPQPFNLPLNEDVDEDGSVGFVDIMSIAGQWTLTGSQGWIREDVNNDGEVGFVDIMMVAGMWGQEW